LRYGLKASGTKSLYEGHGFSRAIKIKRMRALAPEVRLFRHSSFRCFQEAAKKPYLSG
jgi:hypothetical protein